MALIIAGTFHFMKNKMSDW